MVRLLISKVCRVVSAYASSRDLSRTSTGRHAGSQETASISVTRSRATNTYSPVPLLAAACNGDDNCNSNPRAHETCVS